MSNNYPANINDKEWKWNILYWVTSGFKQGYGMDVGNGNITDYAHGFSTVISHSAYLMWNGIDGNESKKIDIDKLAEIWYNSLDVLSAKQSAKGETLTAVTFEDCANAVLTSAKKMLDSKSITAEQYSCVAKAFEKVGIFTDKKEIDNNQNNISTTLNDDTTTTTTTAPSTVPSTAPNTTVPTTKNSNKLTNADVNKLYKEANKLYCDWLFAEKYIPDYNTDITIQPDITINDEPYYAVRNSSVKTVNDLKKTFKKYFSDTKVEEIIEFNFIEQNGVLYQRGKSGIGTDFETFKELKIKSQTETQAILTCYYNYDITSEIMHDEMKLIFQNGHWVFENFHRHF